MKGLILLLLLSFTTIITSCSFFESDPTPLKLTITATPHVYNPTKSEKVTVIVNVDGGVDTKSYFWTLDGSAFSGGESVEIGPFSDDSFHVINCKVQSGNFTESIETRVLSTEYKDVKPVDHYGQLQVKGANLCDQWGDPVQLRGMSMHGIQYFRDFYTENSIKGLADGWKADIVRISSYVNEGWPDEYLDNPSKWKSWIDERIAYAKSAGIYVLIDWHMLNPGDPLKFMGQAKDFWDYFSKKYANDKYVLFDICNEPNNEDLGYDVTWSSHIKPYADTILNIIRVKNGANNIAIVGTQDWATRPDLVSGDGLNYSNVMYSMHFYAASHTEVDMAYMESAAKSGVAVFVTEFGTQNSSGEGSNNFAMTEKWFTILDKYKISWINWNYSNDERSGAVFLERANLSSVESYSDSTNLKEAGKWILDKIKNR